MGVLIAATPIIRIWSNDKSTGSSVDVYQPKKLGFTSSDTKLNYFIRTDVQILTPDRDADGDEPPFPTYEEALQRLIARWAEIALFHAMVRDVDDPAGVVASVAGIKGPRGFGHSPEEALEALNSALIDWADTKLKNGDDDIPSMGGVSLVIDR